jgi:membrane protein implicated in regulation of membrane protease activity
MDSLAVLRMLYWAMAGGGTALVAVLLFLGTDHDLGHAMDVADDGGLDHGHGEGPGPISLRTILAFIGGWGWGGLIGLDGLGWGLLSIPFGSAIGLVLAAIVFQFMRLLYTQEATSTISASQMVGQSGVVLTAIPSGGTGEVRVNVRGTAIKCLARSAETEEIASGESIMVVEEVGGTLVVRRA